MESQDQNKNQREFYSEFFKLVKNMYKKQEITNEEKLFLKKKAIQQDQMFQKFFYKLNQIDEIKEFIRELLQNEIINKISSSDHELNKNPPTNPSQRRSSVRNSALQLSQIYKSTDEFNNSQMSIMEFFKVEQKSICQIENVNNLPASRFIKRNSDDEEKVLQHLLQQSFSQIKL